MWEDCWEIRVQMSVRVPYPGSGKSTPPSAMRSSNWRKPFPHETIFACKDSGGWGSNRGIWTTTSEPFPLLSNKQELKNQFDRIPAKNADHTNQTYSCSCQLFDIWILCRYFDMPIFGFCDSQWSSAFNELLWDETGWGTFMGGGIKCMKIIHWCLML